MESYRAALAANASPATARLSALPPPPGCAKAARAEGTDAAAEFPGGLTRCAVDPDVILLAVVSGDLAGRSGARAADALIAAALAAAGEDLATPKP